MSDRTPVVPPVFGATGSLAPEYFEQLYAARADPWDFASSAYEKAKYAATLAALPRPTYPRALELGCSIGVLTRELAPRCGNLVAVDSSAAALAQARLRCGDRPEIHFAQIDLPAKFPAGPFDLILVSEVAYYFSAADLALLEAGIAAALAPGGHLLLVHYTGETNYPQTADQVHDSILRRVAAGWKSLGSCRAESYRLDLLEAPAR